MWNLRSASVLKMRNVLRGAREGKWVQEKQAANESSPRSERGKKKQADRPDFVTAVNLATHHYDSHSSRHRITPALELPTRTLREPPQCVPIWNCTRWRLPRFTVTKYARLCGPIPRLIPCGFRRTAVSRHPALWCPDLPPAAACAATSDCLACFLSHSTSSSKLLLNMFNCNHPASRYALARGTR